MASGNLAGAKGGGLACWKIAKRGASSGWMRELDFANPGRVAGKSTGTHGDLEDEPSSRTPGRRTLVEVEQRRLGIGGGSDGVDPAIASAVDRARAGGGEGLPAALRTRFERSLGTDLGDVRVHRSGDAATAAAKLSARAFACGRDVFMAAGAYAPGTRAGDALLAHEVAHTVQQRGAVRPPELAVSAPGGHAEHEADRAAAAMIAGMPARVSATPLAIARTPGDAPAPHEPTMTVASSDAVNPATAQERAAADQGGGPDLAHGLGMLRRHTAMEVLAAVRDRLDHDNASDPDWHGAQVERPANAGATLATLCQEIWYLASQMYLVDRTGHVLPGDFHHDINVASLEPGGVYFWGDLALTGHQTTTVHRLFRIDGGVRQVAGDIVPRSAMGEIAMIERARNAMQLHHGIGVIVSPHAATARRQHGWDGARLWRALRRVPGRIPWAVRAGIASLLDNPAQALIGQLQNQAMARAAQWIGRAAGPVGVVALMHTGWELGETLAIASGAHATDDEIDIAAQAVARQVVSMVAGELVDRGLARAGRALRARVSAPHPTEPSAPAAPQQVPAQQGPHPREPVSTSPHAQISTPPPHAAEPQPHAPPATATARQTSEGETGGSPSAHAGDARTATARRPASDADRAPARAPSTQAVPPASSAEELDAHRAGASSRAPVSRSPHERVVHADGQVSGPGRPRNERERLQAATRAERETRAAAAAQAHDRAEARAQQRREQIGAERDQMIVEDLHYDTRGPQVEAELRQLGWNTSRINADVAALRRGGRGEVDRLKALHGEHAGELLEELAEIRTEIARNHERRSALTREEEELEVVPELKDLYRSLRSASPGDGAAVAAIRAAHQDVLGLPAVATDPIAADHLVPLVEIVRMDGFASIRSRAVQLAILNGFDGVVAHNLRPLRRSLNSARGERSWLTWLGWEAVAQGNTAVLEAMRIRVRALAAEETAMRVRIQAMIQHALATQPTN